ncbi:MAG: acetyl-CoA carboxylase biotin carboxyl carrier protein subunit [Deltaproteobacteria bacterium]|nr:acetyl-CoA carboxylase biotin carboxyl carrier protein subunit [Deltaproteobacteria bacterium]
MSRQFKLKVDGKKHAIEVDGTTLFIDEIPFVIGTSNEFVTLDGIAYHVRLEENKAIVDGQEFAFESSGFKSRPAAKKEIAKKPKIEASKGSVLSVMPGAIIKMFVKLGDIVEPGSVLMILEAMKMENEILTERGGVVKKVHVAIGDKVEAGQPLADIE